MIFKILRNAGSAPDRGKVCIVGRNPEALWFDDYEDRVLFDEAGLYDYARVSAAGQAPGRATTLQARRRIAPSSRRLRMIDKRVASAAEAVSDIFDGATIMIGGFGEAGSPIELIHALIDQGATNLTMISNNCGSGQVGLAALLKAGRVSKVVCSFPRTANSTVFPELYRSGRTKLELVPQGTLAERIRAGGAGIPAFYTPSAVGTPLAEGKECREFGGRKYLLEHGIRADFSLIKGRVADTHGNILYNKTARNFGPLMAMAAKVTIVQVAEVVEPGKLDPESIVTPGIFVDRVVAIANPAHESELVEAGASYP